MSIKHMPVKEFRELGYLQEVNRRFLHPLGLALEITVDDVTGEEKITGVWDYRDDPEGIAFAKSLEEMSDFRYKADMIESIWNNRRPAREQALGYMIQPVERGQAEG